MELAPIVRDFAIAMEAVDHQWIRAARVLLWPIRSMSSRRLAPAVTQRRAGPAREHKRVIFGSGELASWRVSRAR
jgi:hypothetical protein